MKLAAVMRSRFVAIAGTVVVLAACGSDQVARRSASPRPTPAAATPSATTTSTASARCNEDIPFEPTYLPWGFKDELIEGGAPGGRPADDDEQVIFHVRGSRERAIEIRRPGTLFAELALADDAPTINVLGTDTPNFGPIEPGGDDFIVFITYPKTADSANDCATFSLNEVGVSLELLKQVATSLRENS